MSTPLSLPLDEIHLWLTYYDELDDEQLHKAYRVLLNEAESAQEPRFYFAKDRRRYLVTRALVRTVLSRYAPVRPEDWAFATNEYGRPHIANAELVASQIAFNISHTDSLIVLAVCRRRVVGVDVENFSARTVSINIADRYFAPEEVRALASVPGHLQQYRFFEYWTFKESYIKARGMGLSLPLDKFSFHYAHDRAVDIAIDPELGDQPARWQFWQFRPRAQYLVAVCAERSLPQPASLVIRQVVPLVREDMLAAEFLRTSQ